VNNIEVYAVKAGVGKINCSSATQLVIDKLNTDFVIDARNERQVSTLEISHSYVKS